MTLFFISFRAGLAARLLAGIFISLTTYSSALSQNQRVMLLIDEKNLGTIPTAEVEALAVSRLLQTDFQVVDQEMVRANLKKRQQLLQTVGDNRGAAALGLQFDADLVISGEAVAKPSARRIADSNLRTYQAVVTLRAIRTDTSEAIASVSETAAVVEMEDVSGGSKALKLAATKALDKLIPDLNRLPLNQGKENEPLPERTVITLGGIDQVWKLKAVRDALVARAALKNVVQRSYTAGIAIFEVDTTTPAKDLAEELVLSPPTGLRLQVLEIQPGKIDLRAVDEKRN